jgi:hypothetical protein
VTTVELRRRLHDGVTIETLARISAPDAGGPALIEPADPADRAWLDEMLAGGVVGRDGGIVRAEDGEPFVAALPAAFRGSRLWAEAVADDPD